MAPTATRYCRAATARTFWSLGRCDWEGYQVSNIALSSGMPFRCDPDGSLTLDPQNESLGKAKEATWLAAPKGGIQPEQKASCARSGTLTGLMDAAARHNNRGLVRL
jgi:hypothetical protein